MYFNRVSLRRLCRLRQCRCQRQLDLAQARDIVLNDDRIIVLQIQADIRTQACTLRKEHQVLQEEIALYNIRGRLRLGQAVLTNAEDRLLFGIIALTTEHELLTRRLNLYHLSETMHVPNNLLEIRRRHRDNALELNCGDRNGPHIQLNQIQREMRDHLFLTIHNLDPQLGGVRLPHKQNDTLVVAHRLHELVEVDHIQPQDVLLGTVEFVEPVGLETEMHQDRVGSVHRHNLEPGAVEF